MTSPSIQIHTNSKGMLVHRIHYSADPKKDAAWAAESRKGYPSEALWKQEQEIDFKSFEGQLVFPEFTLEATMVEPYSIPQDVTWWMGIDPHPRTPHAFLWMFVDRVDNHVYCREYWPSKIYGRSGNIPEDDDLFQIDDYVETISFLEGPTPNIFAPNGYTDNQGKATKIWERVMDPAGKAFQATVTKGKPENETFWQRYNDLGICCIEAKKDFNASRDLVGQRLRPRRYVGPDGERQQSQILIFNTCKELLLELQTCRYPVLTPDQAARRDPVEEPLGKRKHLLDLLRYVEMQDPFWVDPTRKMPKVERGVR